MPNDLVIVESGVLLILDWIINKRQKFFLKIQLDLHKLLPISKTLEINNRCQQDILSNCNNLSLFVQVTVQVFLIC